MSLVKEILRINARYYPLGHKQLYEYLFNETIYGKKINKNSLYTTLNRMRRAGLLKDNSGKLSITKIGKIFLEKSRFRNQKFYKQEDILNNRAKPRRLIVIFDIPEKKKLYREWLRTELVRFGFNLIQKSVWFGPVLPKKFIEYLDEIRLLKHIKFFRATEKDLI